MENDLKIPPSDEQTEVVVESFLSNRKLVMIPSERQWILNKVKKIEPKAKILSAHLDTENVMWIVKISI